MHKSNEMRSLFVKALHDLLGDRANHVAIEQRDAALGDVRGSWDAIAQELAALNKPGAT